MSFIDYKERVFIEKEYLPRIKSLKRKPTNTLSFISQSTDPRAWSIDPTSQRDYILDPYYENYAVKKSFYQESSCSESDSSVSSGKCPSFKKVGKVKKKRHGLKKSKILENICKQFLDDANSYRLQEEKNESLSVTNVRINELLAEKEKAEKSAQAARDEVENLRNFVKEVQDELTAAQKLKMENLKLRSELNIDLKQECQTAQDEINYLSSQLDIFKNYQTEYYNLKELYNNLKEEHSEMNLSLVKCSTDNNDMKRIIEDYQGNTCRELYASNAIVDRDVLRERVRLRDESINFLKTVVEEQQYIINDLSVKLERLTLNVSNKEVLLSKHMEALKCALHEKNGRIMYLEEKLYTSDLLIRELENLRNQFRLANAMLNENMLNYRTQFISVISCSEKLLAERESIEEKMSEKDEQIKKLSRFPQSPRTVVYLSQILHILQKSEDSVTDPTETIFSYVPSIRRIVDNIKNELWNQETADSIIDLRCTTTQTELLLAERFTQCEIYYSNKFAEADIPDRLYFENQNLRNVIVEMKNSIATLEEAYYKKDTANKEFEKKLISAANEKSAKDQEIVALKNQLNLTQEKLLILKGELDYNDSLLKKALEEIDIEQSVSECTSDLLSVSLDSTLQEYNKHVDALESFIADKEQQIEHLQNHINEEIYSKNQYENEYISKLENELQRLTENNIREKECVRELNAQVSYLKQKISEKNNNFIAIKEKLKKAENLFDKINKLDNSQLLIENIDKSENEDPEILAEMSSNKILLYGERIQNRLEEEKNIIEKLQKESCSKTYIENLIKTHYTKKKKLKAMIKQLNNNIGKLKKELIRSKNKIKTSEIQICNYESNISELRNNFEKVREEKNKSLEQLNVNLKEIENVKSILAIKDKDFEALKCEKHKMENVLMGIISNLEQSLSVRSEKESIGTITDTEKIDDSQIKSLTSKNKELSAVIVELQDRLDSLLYVPEKEKDAIDVESVGVQTHDNDKDKFQEMEIRFKGILKKVEIDQEAEKQRLAKRYHHKTKIFKRYLKMIMNCLQEHLVRMQEEHTQEMNRLQVLHEEKMKPLVNRSELETSHKCEVEKLKAQYENKLLSKDEELKKGVKELRIEIKNIIAMKEDTIHKIKEVTNIRMNYLKKKFKKNIMIAKKNLKLLQNKYEELKNTPKVGIEKIDIGSQADCLIPINTRNIHAIDKSTLCSLSKETIKSDSIVQCLIQKVKLDNETQTDSNSEPKEGLEKDDECIVTLDQESLPKPKRDHIIFHLPPTKNIDINYKESIKCSIKETKSTFIRDLFPNVPSYKGGGDAPIRDLCLMKDKNMLVSRIEELEVDLTQKTEDFNRNVNMYQETIRRQKTKLKEMEYALNQETLQTYHLQHRLGVEFNRAELLQAERNVLRDYVDSLQKYIQEHMPTS